MAVVGGRVQVFALDQGGMPGPRPIELVRPFSGSACLSRDGRSLLILSPPAAVTPTVPSSAAMAPNSAPAPAPASPQSSQSAQALQAAAPEEKATLPSRSSGDAAASLLAPGTHAAQLQPPNNPGVHPSTASAPPPTPAATALAGPATGEVSEDSSRAEHKDPGPGEAPKVLCLDVYLLGSMEFFSSFPLEGAHGSPGVTGSPGELSLGATVFGAQHSLLLHHRSSGSIQSRVLDISTRDEEYRMRPEPVAKESKPGEQRFAASPAPALEAMYHAMDKFATSPCLSSASRTLALRLVLPGTEPSSAAPEREPPGLAQGTSGVLENHVKILQKKLGKDSAKDFSLLALQVTTVKSSAELSPCSSGGVGAAVASGGAATEPAGDANYVGPQPLVQLSQWANRVMCLVPV